jgi:hypothetical protein
MTGFREIFKLPAYHPFDSGSGHGAQEKNPFFLQLGS